MKPWQATALVIGIAMILTWAIFASYQAVHFSALAEKYQDDALDYRVFTCMDGCIFAERISYGQNLTAPTSLYNACSGRCWEEAEKVHIKNG